MNLRRTMRSKLSSLSSKNSARMSTTTILCVPYSLALFLLGSLYSQSKFRRTTNYLKESYLCVSMKWSFVSLRKVNLVSWSLIVWLIGIRLCSECIMKISFVRLCLPDMANKLTTISNTSMVPSTTKRLGIQSFFDSWECFRTCFRSREESIHRT